MTRAHLRPTIVGLALAALLPLAACSSDDDGGASSPDTVVGSSSTPGTLPPCVSLTPGVVVPEAEALVRFTPEGVCPGYVTVQTGTTVSWENDDDVAHDVVVAQAGAAIVTQTVGPGEVWGYEFTDPGMFDYTTDALPDFRGVVEVQALGV